MKPILASILFLLFITTTHAQKPSKLDSLKNVLAHLPAEGKSFAGDTLRVRVLCEVASKFKEQPDSTLFYSNLSIKLGRKIKFSTYEVDNLINQAYSYKYKGLNFNSIDLLTEAKLIAEKKKNDLKIARIDRSIADNYLWVSEYKLAEKHYYEAMRLFKKLEEFEEFADTQNNLAVNYNKQKDFIKAINLLQDCFKYLPYIKGEISEISFYENLSLAYSGLNRHEEAIKNAEKALEKYKLLSKKRPLQLELSRSYIILGFNQLRGGYVNDALNSAKLCEMYNSDYNGNQIELNQLYYEVFKAKKDEKKALYFLERYKNAENKKVEVEQNRLINAYKAIYELDKEKIRVIELNSTIQKNDIIQKNSLIGLIISILIACILLFSYVRIRSKNKEIEEQKNEIGQLNSELEKKVLIRTKELSDVNKELIEKNFEITEALLKGQTLERKRVAADLHDNLGSTLSALKWRLEALGSNNLNTKEKEIYRSIKNMMNDAYNDVRNISHNLFPAELESKGLIGALDKLCSDINENGKVHFTINSQGNFTVIIPKMALEIYSICMELITNILKHSKATKAHIDLTITQREIIINISDNGIGVENKNILNGHGLKNITNRVKMLNGYLKVHSQFSLQKANPFSVEVFFPIES
jgi:signal transduction histidine kinase